ncbi:MAG: UvrB/UvrC motif-containing protein [Lentisphaerae bacterium]|nr:UvrB/UvrC motif-containing protein [Lentisphaerota bacterium]
MKCELCQQNEATVHFKQIVDSVAKELFVCAACAAKNGFEIESPTSLTDFLFGMGVQGDVKPPAGDKTCPACGLRREDFDKRSRLGCPTCYETFEEELRPYLEGTHAGTRHAGKVPATEQVSEEIAALREALDKAVARQDFEEAAALRDKVRALQGAAAPDREPA